MTFTEHPDVHRSKIDTFSNHIADYRRVVESGDSLTTSLRTIADALADTSAMESLWFDVMAHLSNSPRPLWNNEPWWKDWIGDLVTTTSDLPALLLRIRISNTPIYNDREWDRLRRKVVFLDEQMDYAYTNKWGGFSPRKDRVHLGKETNELMQERLPAERRLTRSGTEFKFTENTAYAYGYWDWPSDHVQLAVTEVCMATFHLLQHRLMFVGVVTSPASLAVLLGKYWFIWGHPVTCSCLAFYEV